MLILYFKQKFPAELSLNFQCLRIEKFYTFTVWFSFRRFNHFQFGIFDQMEFLIFQNLATIIKNKFSKIQKKRLNFWGILPSLPPSRTHLGKCRRKNLHKTIYGRSFYVFTDNWSADRCLNIKIHNPICFLSDRIISSNMKFKRKAFWITFTQG